MKNNKIVCLDYGCFIHQSIFGKINMPENSPPSDYICLSSMIGCLKKIGIEKKDQIIVAVDFLKSWRKQVAEEYKGDRKAKREKYPIDWKREYAKMDRLLENLEEATNWLIIKVPHTEADDVMSVIVRDNQDREVILCTFDSDLQQLFNYNNCKVFSPKTKRYKIKPKNFNVAKFLSKKIRKEASDNLKAEIYTEEDWDNRYKIVNLLELPEWVDEKIKGEINKAELEDNDIEEPELLLYDSLVKRYYQIYSKKKVETYEKSKKYYERKAKRKKKKRSEK